MTEFLLGGIFFVSPDQSIEQPSPVDVTWFSVTTSCYFIWEISSSNN